MQGWCLEGRGGDAAYAGGHHKKGAVGGERGATAGGQGWVSLSCMIYVYILHLYK